MKSFDIASSVYPNERYAHYGTSQLHLTSSLRTVCTAAYRRKWLNHLSSIVQLAPPVAIRFWGVMSNIGPSEDCREPVRGWSFVSAGRGYRQEVLANGRV